MTTANQPGQPPRLYSSADAAAMLGVSDARVRQLCKALGIQRHGRDWLLTEDDLTRMRARQANPPQGGWPKGKPRGRKRRNEVA